MPAAHAIYAAEMRSLKHGYPLWEPECNVSIGDVGYTRDGRFCRLFSAALNPGDFRNEFGVPKGYRPLDLDERAVVESTLPPGPMFSSSITKHGSDIGATASILQAGLGFKFSCEKDRGAVLIINSEARRKDSEQRGAFEKYMRKHHKSWLDFANDKPNSRGISLSDLIFVTGHDHTADWAVAAFSKSSTLGAVQFQAGFPNAAGANFSAWGSWMGIASQHSHCGPRIHHRLVELAARSGKGGQMCAASLGSYNQCIFVRGFRVIDRISLFGIKSVARLFPGEIAMECSTEIATAVGITVTVREKRDSSESVQTITNAGDNPVSVQTVTDAGGSVDHVKTVSDGVENSAQLLEYILKQNPEADIAFVHDDDLAAIMDKTDSLDFSRMLSEVSPPVVIDSEGVATISFDASDFSEVSRPSHQAPRTRIHLQQSAGVTFRA